MNCILLVDDDKATNFLNHRLLTKMEVSQGINTARNGAEALDYLNNSLANHPEQPQPDLILLDINMPLLDGWEFLEAYQNFPDEVRQSIVIIMLTTSLREDDVKRAKQFPFVKGFINKPLTPVQLQDIIGKHFQLNS